MFTNNFMYFLPTHNTHESFLTFPAFRWGHMEPEPHLPQSLSIHSSAWGVQYVNSSFSHSILGTTIYPLQSAVLEGKRTTPQDVGTLCASERCLDHTQKTPLLLGSTWRVPYRSLSWRMPWAAVPDPCEASPAKYLCVSKWQRMKGT